MRSEFKSIIMAGLYLSDKFFIESFLLVPLTFKVLFLKNRHFQNEEVLKLRLSCVFDPIVDRSERSSTTHVFFLKLVFVLLKVVVDGK